MTRSARSVRPAAAALALGCLLACPASGSAPFGPARADGSVEVAAPTLTPGDSFRFRQGERGYVVQDVGWDGALFLSLVEFEDGRAFRDWYTADLNMVASEQVGSPERTTHQPDSMKYRFPMRVGLAWSGSYETVSRTTSGHVTQRYETAVSCEVRCLERVEVPAGAFESFRIECARKDSDQAHEELATYWYSPEAGVSVLAEFVRRDMPALVDHIELVAFDRAARTPFRALPAGTTSTCDFRVAAE